MDAIDSRVDEHVVDVLKSFRNLLQGGDGTSAKKLDDYYIFSGHQKVAM